MGLPVIPWSAASTGSSLRTASPVVSESQDLTIDMSGAFFTILAAFGYPSHVGTLRDTFERGGETYESILKYVTLQNLITVSSDNSYDYELAATGLRGTLTLEDGTEVPFDVGTPFDLVVPSGADVNGDGRVEVVVTYTLDASFSQERSWVNLAGYQLWGGFVELTIRDGAGDVAFRREVGPTIERRCGIAITPESLSAEPGIEQYVFRSLAEPCIQQTGDDDSAHDTWLRPPGPTRGAIQLR